MQAICTSLQTDNHINTSSLNFYRLGALSDAQPTVSKHWRLKHTETTLRATCVEKGRISAVHVGNMARKLPNSNSSIKTVSKYWGQWLWQQQWNILKAHKVSSYSWIRGHCVHYVAAPWDGNQSQLWIKGRSAGCCSCYRNITRANKRHGSTWARRVSYSTPHPLIQYHSMSTSCSVTSYRTASRNYCR